MKDNKRTDVDGFLKGDGGVGVAESDRSRGKDHAYGFCYSALPIGDKIRSVRLWRNGPAGGVLLLCPSTAAPGLVQRDPRTPACSFSYPLLCYSSRAANLDSMVRYAPLVRPIPATESPD